MTESKENVEHVDLDVAEILVRKIPDDQQLIDLRLCVLVSADVGKGTLLGVLTPQGELDNGRAGTLTGTLTRSSPAAPAPSRTRSSATSCSWCPPPLGSWG